MEEIDLGYSYDDMDKPVGIEEKKVYYPEFQIDSMDANLGKSVGTDFTVKMKLCLKSISKKPDGKYCYGVEVKSIMPEDDSEKGFGELLEEAAKGE